MSPIQMNADWCAIKIAYKPRQIKNPSLKITHKLKNMVTFVHESKAVIRDYE